MTATPIPRTLALTLHGDLDVSQIDELPPGRQAIQTTALTSKERPQAFDLIRREVAQGHQVYIIFPMIEESEKLATISDEATDIRFQIYTDETSFVEFDEGILNIQPSTTITPSFESPNIVKFNMAFPTEAAHQHFYNLVPVAENLITPDYMNYLVTSIATPFIEDSLRVYVNGVRIYSDVEVYVPGAMVDDAWTLLSFTPDHINGSFELSSALSSEDVIRIDFDTALL